MTALHDPVPSRAHDLAIEVVVMWGDDPATADILHVGYVAPDRDFSVGDAMLPDGTLATNYLIDQAQLGLPLFPVVVQSERGPLLVVPTGSSLRTVNDRGVQRTAAQLLVDDALCASGHKTFPFALPITKGTNAWLSYCGFTFVVRETALEQPIAASRVPDWKEQRYTLASFGAHLFLLALFYYAPPASSAMASDAVSVREAYIDYFDAPPEVELEPLPVFEGGGSPADGAQAPQGDQGALGEPKATTKSNKWQQASKKNPEPTRDELRNAAAQAGIIGMLAAAQPIAGEGEFNAASASGFDANSALASLLATQSGPSFGNGLGMAGPGRGGGGNAYGTVAGGPLGTRGRGPGGPGGSGDGGYGAGTGILGGRGIRVPTAIGKLVTVNGGLSKEVIRRTIQRNLNQVRFCYEQALQTKPDLQGRVAVRFIIGPTGAVQVSVVESSDLGDRKAEACITSAVGRWNFAAPEGSGIVSVTYPFVLEQVGQ
jgi:hypothetical protein